LAPKFGFDSLERDIIERKSQTDKQKDRRKEPIDRQKMDCLENKWTDRQVDKQADGKRDI
jgi:hypothetical protein